MSLFESPEPSIGRIAEIVSEDPGLAALVLKIANSAFFGNTKTNLDVNVATAQLGVDVMKTFALTFGLFSPLQASACAAFDPKRFWRRSLSAGQSMRRIVEMHGCSDIKPSDAFLVGLLLDVGQLILATQLGHRYAQISSDQIGCPGGLTAAEMNCFNVSHAEVGAYLLGTWGFPDVLVETVAFHHRPTKARVKNPSLLAIAAVVSAAVDCQDTNKPLMSEIEELRSQESPSSLNSWFNICREVAA